MLFKEDQIEERNEKIANLYLKPSEKELSKMILTLDADTVAYAVASVCEAGDDEAGYTLDMKYAFEEACSRIDNILNHSGCKSVELHFTTGKNFRFTLTDTYKANRSTTRSPAGLYDLKVALSSKYEGGMHSDIEADDHVSWQKKFWPSKYIIGSPDKDVYNGNEGVHFNYYKRAKGKYIKEDIPMKWVKTTKMASLVWTYMQVLMGDSTDGIAGIKLCGPVKAIKILCPSILPELEELKKVYKEKHGKAVSSDKLWDKIITEYGLVNNLDLDETILWSRTVTAYLDAGMEEKDAILNMRLVNMHQVAKDETLQLWTQPVKESNE